MQNHINFDIPLVFNSQSMLLSFNVHGVSTSVNFFYRRFKLSLKHWTFIIFLDQTYLF